MKNERVLYLDVLRVLAVFCMIALHVSASNWYEVPPASFEWQVFNVYDCAARFCVPMFLMISGLLFLDPSKEMPLRKLFGKYIFRMIAAYAFWSALYAVISSKININIENIFDSTKTFIVNYLNGHYHLWFIFVIAGLYLIVPFLRKITADKKLTEYFLLLAFVFSCLLPALRSLLPLSGKIMDLVLPKLNMYFVLGYTVFFVAGYYFGTYGVPKRLKRIIYALGIASVLFTIVISSYLSVRDNYATETWYGYLLPNTAFTTLAIFLFIKDFTPKLHFGDKVVKALTHVSNCGFGIYLFHALVIKIFADLGLSTMSFNPILSVPVISLLCFVCSFIVIHFVSKIPLLNRYIM